MGLIHQSIELGLQGGAIDLVVIEELAQHGEFLVGEKDWQPG